MSHCLFALQKLDGSVAWKKKQEGGYKKRMEEKLWIWMMMNADEGLWMMMNDEWGCGCIMVDECILNDYEGILSYVNSCFLMASTQMTAMKQGNYTKNFCAEKSWRRRTLIRRNFYTEIHRDIFTQRSFYKLKLLHREVSTQRRFYTQKSDTEKLLCSGAFTHRCVYTEEFSHRSIYTKGPLRTDTFTHRNILQRSLHTHTETFTQRSLYTEEPLHTDPFRHRNLYAQMRLHIGTFTRRSF